MLPQDLSLNDEPTSHIGYRILGKVEDWPVAIVTVVRPTNPGITELGLLASLITN